MKSTETLVRYYRGGTGFMLWEFRLIEMSLRGMFLPHPQPLEEEAAGLASLLSAVLLAIPHILLP